MTPIIGPLVVFFGSMSLSDFINGVFEAGLSFFLWKGVLKLRVDKAVLGFYWPTVAWTTAWGLYNLYFYPHLDQWFSFSGGIAVVLVNMTWLTHVAHYSVTHGGGSWRRFMLGGSDIDDRRRADLEQQKKSQRLATEARTSETSTPVCPMCGMVNHERPFPVRGSGMCLRDDCPD